MESKGHWAVAIRLDTGESFADVKTFYYEHKGDAQARAARCLNATQELEITGTVEVLEIHLAKGTVGDTDGE